MIHLLLCLFLISPGNVLVLKNGKKIACDRYERKDGRVTFYSGEKSYAIPENLVDWPKSQVASVRAKKQKKKPARPSEPVYKRQKSGPIVLTNELYKKMDRKSDQPVTVTYKEMGNSIIVRATLNGAGPYDFILDTGAAITLIAPGVLSELGLSPVDGGVNVVGVAGKTVQAGTSVIEEVSLGGARVRDLKVASHDIPMLNDARIVGLLGQDFLNYFVMNLNSANKTLTLTPHAGAAARADRKREYEELLRDPFEGFRELSRIYDDLSNLMQVYTRMEPNRQNARHIQRLKVIALEIPDLKRHMDKLYEAVEEAQKAGLPEEHKAGVSQFLTCYPQFSGYLVEMQRFSKALRRAYSNTGSVESIGDMRAMLRDEWIELADASKQFRRCGG